MKLLATILSLFCAVGVIWGTALAQAPTSSIPNATSSSTGSARRASSPAINDPEAEQRNEQQNVIRSKVDKDVYFYIEDPKTSKAQRRAWEKKCKRKYSKYDEQKKCFDRLKQKFLDAQDE